jgi:hypothetical protein
MDRTMGSGAPWGDLAPASIGVHQRRRICAIVMHGHRVWSVLWRCERRNIFTLHAGVPIRRPSCDFATTFIAISSPSGQVLGVGIVRCAVKRIILNGEVGQKKNLVLLFGHVCNS